MAGRRAAGRVGRTLLLPHDSDVAPLRSDCNACADLDVGRFTTGYAFGDPDVPGGVANFGNLSGPLLLSPRRSAGVEERTMSNDWNTWVGNRSVGEFLSTIDADVAAGKYPHRFAAFRTYARSALSGL